MKSHELNTSPRTTKTRKGRGISAGKGKTAGRGTKGQNARAGGRRRPGFEGGQSPLFQRIPKQRGFKSYRQSAKAVSLDRLNNLSTTDVNPETLTSAGILSDASQPAKIVASGEVSKKLKVSGVMVSAGATKAIEAAGGTVAK